MVLLEHDYIEIKKNYILNFNPSMVLLELMLHVSLFSVLLYFNPSMVLLEHDPPVREDIKTDIFQSQYGLIRTLV